jgi:tetratricopeptide (TPR) repeat protein
MKSWRFLSRTGFGWLYYLFFLLLGSLWPSPNLLVTLVLAQSSVTPTEALALANQNYEEGQYSEAAAIYQAIINSGLHHSTVYYNLGNAYFKQGELGWAILSYRRAQLLNPRDPDIAANLAVARAQTVDKLEAPSEGTWVNLIQIIAEWLTLREATVVALLLWLVLCFLTVLAILKPLRRRWFLVGIAVTAGLLAIGLISITNRTYTEHNFPPAVIVAKQVDVTSGPGGAGQYLVEFNLHAGAEVRVLESRSGYQRISLPGDLQGWVPNEALERVME